MFYSFWSASVVICRRPQSFCWGVTSQRCIQLLKCSNKTGGNICFLHLSDIRHSTSNVVIITKFEQHIAEIDFFSLSDSSILLTFRSDQRSSVALVVLHSKWILFHLLTLFSVNLVDNFLYSSYWLHIRLYCCIRYNMCIWVFMFQVNQEIY